MSNSLREALDRHGDRVALIDAATGETISYARLAAAADRFAALGAGDDPVTVVSSRRPMQAVAIVAGLAAGALVHPVAADTPPARLRALIDEARPRLVLADDSPAFDDARAIDTLLHGETAPSRAESAGGLLIYTSGTTGSAKGVALRWPLIETNVRYSSSAFGYDASWITASVLPLTHTFTLVSDVLPMLLLGGTAVIAPAFDLRRAHEIVDALTRYRVQSYSAVPILFEALTLLRADLSGSALRFAVAGAAPLRESVRLAYAARFCHEILPCYGLTETVCFATLSRPEAIRAGSAGRPAGIDVRVVEAAPAGESPRFDRPVPDGGTGELVMRGPSVIGSYFRDGGRHAAVFSGDGWFATGDVGHIDEDGWVYVTGRRKNMIIRGGAKVYLEDVDRALAAQPGVRDCCALAFVEADRADRAIAFVAGEGDPEQFGRAIAAELGAGHVPDAFVFLESIPRTPTGKPRQEELRAIIAARATA